MNASRARLVHISVMNTTHKDQVSCTRGLARTVLLATLFAGLCGYAAAQEPVHGRVSATGGDALIMGTSDTGWSGATLNTLVLPGDTLWAGPQAVLELELPGNVYFRMADRSTARLERLAPGAIIRGYTGAFYVQRLGANAASARMVTDACMVDIERGSIARIDIADDGLTTLTVRSGRATMRPNNGMTTAVLTGFRVAVAPGLRPSYSQRVADGLDGFDEWNAARAGYVSMSPPQLFVAGARNLPLGYIDLAPHGNWFRRGDVNYWHPNAADYVPFRYGYWSWLPEVGYVWIDDYAFGYITSHYGRWVWDDVYGWVWTYEPGWSPAWVAAARYGDVFTWSPLDAEGQPVLVEEPDYYVGGIGFSSDASSYCPAEALIGGRSSVRPLVLTVLEGTRPHEIYVWNILTGRDSRARLPFFGATALVRDYEPRRTIRGQDVVTLPQGLLPDKEAARANVRVRRSAELSEIPQRVPVNVRADLLRAEREDRESVRRERGEPVVIIVPPTVPERSVRPEDVAEGFAARSDSPLPAEPDESFTRAEGRGSSQPQSQAAPDAEISGSASSPPREESPRSAEPEEQSSSSSAPSSSESYERQGRSNSAQADETSRAVRSSNSDDRPQRVEYSPRQESQSERARAVEASSENDRSQRGR